MWGTAFMTHGLKCISPIQPTSGLANQQWMTPCKQMRRGSHPAVFNLTLNNLRWRYDAHRRGVEVLVVTESDNLDGEDFQRLKEAGVPVLGDRREGTMHNKFMVIDGAEVWTGSMNFTVSGAYFDNNAIMRIRSAELAAYEQFADRRTTPGDAGRCTPNPGGYR
jgi:hypothetical protein